MECVEWGGRVEQRDVAVREVGKETEKRTKHYANCVNPLANTNRKAILFELGKLRQ